MEEGWYLMSARDLEIELARHRRPDVPRPSSNAVLLSTKEALEYKQRGNLPDELERTLRLVIHVPSDAPRGYIERRRGELEPDFHDAPTWRREGSKPVNVVPLRAARRETKARPWWEQPEIAALEREWRQTGTVAGMPVPAQFRSFVYKTVVSLRAAGKEVTPTSVSDSIARWVPPHDAAAIRHALGGD